MLESKLSGWKEEELSVIYTKVVVKGKGRDQSTETDSVHDEEYRAKSRALGEHHNRKYERMRGCYHI